MHRDRFIESTNPDHCSHPNMVPVTYRTPDAPDEDKQGAECPDCFEAWPK